MGLGQDYGSGRQTSSQASKESNDDHRQAEHREDKYESLLDSLSNKLPLLVFTVLSALTYTSYSSIAPFFPSVIFFVTLLFNFCPRVQAYLRERTKKLAKNRRLSESTIGLIFVACSVTQCISSLMLGKLMPIFGSKPFIIGGCVLLGTCTALTGSLNSIDDPVLFTVLSFLLRFLVGLGIGSSSTATVANVALLYPTFVTTALGFMELACGLGYMLGPAIGGALYQIGGFALPFIVIGGLAILGGCSVIFLITEPQGHSENKPSTVSSEKILTYRGVFSISATYLLNLVVLQEELVWGFLEVGGTLHLEQFHLEPAAVGGIFLLAGGGYGILSPLAGAFVDKTLFHRPVILVGLLVGVLGLLLAGPSPVLHLPSSVGITVAGVTLIGVSSGLCVVPSYSNMFCILLSKGYLEDLTTYGIVTAIMHFSMFIGQTVGPLVGGVLIDAVGWSWTATIFAGINLLIGVVLLAFSLWEMKGCKWLCSQERRTQEKSEQQYILSNPED